MGVPHEQGVVACTECSQMNFIGKERYLLVLFNCNFLDQFGLDCPYFKYMGIRWK